MVSIAKALGQVKEDFRNLLPEQSILDVCKQVGQTFRRRLLGPVKTVYLFLLQVLHGNLAISGPQFFPGSPPGGFQARLHPGRCCHHPVPQPSER